MRNRLVLPVGDRVEPNCVFDWQLLPHDWYVAGDCVSRWGILRVVGNVGACILSCWNFLFRYRLVGGSKLLFTKLLSFDRSHSRCDVPGRLILSVFRSVSSDELWLRLLLCFDRTQ